MNVVTRGILFHRSKCLSRKPVHQIDFCCLIVSKINIPQTTINCVKCIKLVYHLSKKFLEACIKRKQFLYIKKKFGLILSGFQDLLAEGWGGCMFYLCPADKFVHQLLACVIKLDLEE